MIDRLIYKIQKKENPAVIGLDPTLEMMPAFLKEEMFERYGKTPEAVAKLFLEFNKGIIDALEDLVPAVKPQIAMYEQFGAAGIQAYIDTVSYAKSKDLIVIGDIKRGDISSTAAAYAGHLAGVEIEGNHFDPWMEDCVTINPYMGSDGIRPFISACNQRDKGLFILVKTSNPSGGELQDLAVIAGGATLVDSASEPLYMKTAELVSTWGKDAMGDLGYSKVGAVVGATYPEQGQILRQAMPHTFFLVPGYGAQGASGKDLKGYFDGKGLGAIISSSRGITAAYKKDAEFGEKEFALSARKAALAMKEDLRQCFYGE